MVGKGSGKNSGRLFPGMGIVSYLIRRKRYLVMLFAVVGAFFFIGEMLDGNVSTLKNSKTKASAFFESEERSVGKIRRPSASDPLRSGDILITDFSEEEPCPVPKGYDSWDEYYTDRFGEDWDCFWEE